MDLRINRRSIVRGSWGLYIALLAATFVWAAIIRFQLPQFPLADNDTPGYLNPALTKLAGLGYIHDHGRNFVYPGLLYLLLRVFDDFRAIAIFQHVLGILTGGFLLLTWEQAGLLLRKSLIHPFWLRVLGLILTATFLTATKPILYESQIRPESVFAFFCVLSLYLNVNFVRFRFLDHQPRAGFVFGVLSLFVAVLLHCLRPSWGFGVIFASLPVAASLFDRTETIRRKCLLIGTAGTFIFGLLILPEHYLAKEDHERKTFGARVVFAIHADLIRDQIGTDLAQGIDLPYPKDWLASVQAALTRDIQITSAFAQKSLGFNSDYIMWEDSAFNKITTDLKGDPDKISAFCWYYYKRALFHQPRRMTNKVLRQLHEFYAMPNQVYQKREYRPNPLGEDYAKSLQVFTGYLSRADVPASISRHAVGMEEARTMNPSIPSNLWFSPLHRPLGIMYLPCLWAAIALSVLIFALPLWRKQLGFFALFTLLVYSYNFGTCLTVAIVHTLEVRRFSFVQLGFTMLAQFLTLALLLQVVAQVVHSSIDRFTVRTSSAAGQEKESL